MEPIKLIPIKQAFSREKLADIPQTIAAEMQPYAKILPPGARIAITAGSRGIANITQIIRSVVTQLKSYGCQPFVIPAMGSHGGATAAGQAAVLAEYGLTEDQVGAPIRSGMEVAELPRGDLPHPLFQDRLAYEADGIIVINRVKIHTDYQGEIESGLMKMCVIGLGKHRQAQIMHRYGVAGLRDMIPPAAEQIIRVSKIKLAIGIVENAYDQTLAIRAIDPKVLREQEKELLQLCRQHMPRLPVSQLDLLIVDRMGKDISGTGLDPNIIGRRLIAGEPELESPRIKRIVVSDLSAAAHGNALGMGLADFITRKLQDKIDFADTYENVLTSTFTDRGKMPIVAENDRQAVDYAMRTWGMIEPGQARIIRIRDTLHLDRLAVSETVLQELRENPAIQVAGEPEELFDGSGNLAPFWS